jgi:glycosyltransferase involved in cell wall biosynthesis
MAEAEGRATQVGNKDEWPGHVSVVVPVRDGANVIEAQLAALSQQDYTGEWELVVSDNGSTDGTPGIVDGWAPKFPALRVVDSSGGASAAHARNVGVDAARGPFIALCDADDMVDPSWLRHLVGAAVPGAVVSGSLAYRQLNDPAVLAWAGVGPGIRPGGLSHLGFLPYAVGANTGVDKAVWEAIGGWDPTLFAVEDQDFSWRAQLAGYPVQSAPDAVVHYRLRPGIRAMAHQVFVYGRGDADLYALHRRNGLRAPRLRRSARTYAGLVARAPLAVVSPAARGRWARDAAYRAGRLRGSLRRRVWFP